MSRLVVSSILAAALFASLPARAQDSPPPSDPPPSTEPAPAQPALPAADPNAPPAQEPAAAPVESAAPAPQASLPVTAKVDAAALTAVPPPPADADEENRAPLTQRILMDVVSGAAGAGVILLLGWAVAAPLALLPMILPPAANSFQVLGIPLSVLVAGGGAISIVAMSVVLGAVVQRLLRPLLGPQPSMLGPILGALFFGSVAMVGAAVAAFLVFSGPPVALAQLRNNVVTGDDISAANGKALAIVGFVTVAAAIPVGALAAAIGGPLSAEREDALAEESRGGGKKKTGEAGGPVRN